MHVIAMMAICSTYSGKNQQV